MRVLPYRRFTIETSLGPDEVRERLREAIAAQWTRGFTQPAQPLVGDFDGTSFDITRYIRGRNSFKPRIRGTVEPAGSGTRLSGTMRLHAIVIVFIGAFVFAAGSVFLAGAARSVARDQLDPMVLPAMGVLAFLTVMTLGGFAIEVHGAFRDLIRVVDASHSDLR